MRISSVTMWVIAAVVAVGVTTAAVTVANASGDRDDVLSQDDVSRQLSDANAAPPATETGSPAAPATGGVSRTLRSQAGQLVAACDGGSVWLEAWSPNPGYRVDEVARGPAREVSVWFESDSYEDVLAVVLCEAGEPRLTDLVEPDDHGGDRDDEHDDDDDDDDDNSGRGGGDDDDRDDDRYDG